MGEKKTAAPAAEQVEQMDEQVRNGAETPQEGAETARRVRGEVQEGIGTQETPLGGVEGALAAVDAARGLNLREGPGTGYAVAEVLPDGGLVAVLELPCGAEVPGWSLVHTGQRTGWVDARFIRKLEAAEAEG